jgi:hypothetical protein
MGASHARPYVAAARIGRALFADRAPRSRIAALSDNNGIR